jgi:hypothetical protein
MTTLKFKCTLLSDIIINQKAATEGPNKTLDFIPGSNFLGIVAADYDGFGDKAMEVFHSGKVRFGDAHPVNEGSSIRSLRIPVAMFYPKLKKPSDISYIHHLIPEKELETLKKEQLKQCRSGFYDFKNNKATEVEADKNFAIKSAHDKEKRRSKDEQMYGYQSLQEGLTLCFEVEIDSENTELQTKIEEALVGKRRVGRSRTAQYGLVEIKKWDYEDIPSRVSKDGLVVVYADSRLIFLDKYGLPTFQPSPEDIGIDGKDAKIVWEKSQIRTFQYTPWNYKRQCYDTDRCGIEKGSVFVIESSASPKNSQYVGAYKNEGFGKVIYNPEFLEADDKGVSKYKIVEKEKEKKIELDEAERNKMEREYNTLKASNNVLLQYLGQQKEQEYIEQDVYKKVNDWINGNYTRFRGDAFASQWGAIRNIAMQNKTKAQLMLKLFAETEGYLTHGVAADKWGERKRLSEFKKFVEEKLDDNNAQIAIINLAAEMAKKCKEGGN